MTKQLFELTEIDDDFDFSQLKDDKNFIVLEEPFYRTKQFITENKSDFSHILLPIEVKTVSDEEKILNFVKYLNDNFYIGANGYTRKGWGGYSSYKNGKIENILDEWIDKGMPKKYK